MRKTEMSSFFFDGSARKQRFILVLLAAVFYIPFIGGVHLFDWDEINFAEISREMMLTGDYFTSQIDFKPFYEKPPLFNWIQIASFSAFGINEFAARFPNALFGVFTLLVLFEIGRNIRNAKFGMLWALLYLGSLTPHFYFKTGIIDPVFNFFIFLSVFFFFKVFSEASANAKTRFALLSGLFSGLAVITKGPVGLLILMLTIFGYVALYKKEINKKLLKHLFLCVCAVFTATLLWFLPQFLRGGLGFFKTFVAYMLELLTQDVATHGQPFYYHFVVVFLGCFPISIIALRNLASLQKQTHYDYTRWMFCLFWVVLLLFSIVKTKIIHYSSMTYMPLAYLAADVLVSGNKKTFPKWLYLAMGLFISLAFGAGYFILDNKKWLLELLSRDAFAQDMVRDFYLPFYIVWIPILLICVTIFAYRAFRAQNVFKAVLIHAIGFAVFINLELCLLLPPVEKAVQGAAIGFYKRLADRDVYLLTLGFHSYGRVYYFNKTPKQAKYSQDELLSAHLDRPLYVVAKTNTLNGFDKRTDFKLIAKKGGYWLFVKKDSSK